MILSTLRDKAMVLVPSRWLPFTVIVVAISLATCSMVRLAETEGHRYLSESGDCVLGYLAFGSGVLLVILLPLQALRIGGCIRGREWRGLAVGCVSFLVGVAAVCLAILALPTYLYIAGIASDPAVWRVVTAVPT